jgi:hypothetical protein
MIMIRRLALVLILIFGISGCSSMNGFFNSEHPGEATFAGGQLQLLFSNPEFSDFNPNDPLAKNEMMQNELFGRRTGSPFVTGGVGMMEIWRF